ncbi:5'-methylthioadenosine/S-adenosylhomocysteine nucleosidase [Maritalea porphyrae]|uniref:5'-methylthioadenosine/S-adenosylhomocysteine nucleosidase n=1 Tax=Maritalea porphyrae TaxID=880732 RepID=UPI0022AF7F7E|nr:5'-methylthioadenosine/S-adenosylhomocysteine nucleosidase [Maritalea porphyrae]MCZ4273122.1 5'-methylthioadenosine/S-adenosylhomocysteine nucleosidase [Maritalea porphyrae]
MLASPVIPNVELKTLKNGKTVLFLMATAAEYLTNLKKIIVPSIIGVGPVEAALNTALILTSVKTLPDFVVLLGSSGSATLPQGEVFQASSIAYRDMDASPLGFEKGQTPFLEQPAVINMTNLVDGIDHASLSTGADIVLTKSFEHIEQDMVDMESYAVLRLCQAFSVPLIVLRGISDGPEELKVYEDWTRLLPTVDKNLFKALRVVLAKIGA